MSELLKDIDARTGSAGSGKLEILMFTLGRDIRTGRDVTFGIDVFNVREVLRIPAITGVPKMPPSVAGLVNLHGVSVPVIDLAKYIGTETDCKPESMMVTEHGGQTQGFLVKGVGNILLVDSAEMRVPPAMLLAEMGGLVSAITELDDGRLVVILDVARVLAETGHFDSAGKVFKKARPQPGEHTVYSADDSSAARDRGAHTPDAMQAVMSHGEARPDDDQVGLPDRIDARAELAGSGKMEILLFSLGGNEKFGINVFKVREVCPAGKIARTPNMPNGVDGIVLLHGNVMPVLNLASFMGMHPEEQHRTMMVAEFNNQVLGFLVRGVDRVIRVDWDKVRAPEGMPDKGTLITATAEMEDGSLITILDVEQILANAFGEAVVGNVERMEAGRDLCIFFADDSAVARKKISEVLDKMGVKHIQASNGNEAWDRLKALADAAHSAGTKLHDRIQVVLTDAEMPEMDGYVLTQHIKADRRFDGIPVVMHSSLSSEANRAMARRVGVDYYVPKFDSMILSSTLRSLLI